MTDNHHNNKDLTWLNNELLSMGKTCRRAVVFAIRRLNASIQKLRVKAQHNGQRQLIAGRFHRKADRKLEVLFRCRTVNTRQVVIHVFTGYQPTDPVEQKALSVISSHKLVVNAAQSIKNRCPNFDELFKTSIDRFNSKITWLNAKRELYAQKMRTMQLIKEDEYVQDRNVSDEYVQDNDRNVSDEYVQDNDRNVHDVEQIDRQVDAEKTKQTRRENSNPISKKRIRGKIVIKKRLKRKLQKMNRPQHLENNGNLDGASIDVENGFFKNSPTKSGVVDGNPARRKKANVKDENTRTKSKSHTIADGRLDERPGRRLTGGEEDLILPKTKKRVKRRLSDAVLSSRINVSEARPKKTTKTPPAMIKVRSMKTPVKERRQSRFHPDKAERANKVIRTSFAGPTMRKGTEIPSASNRISANPPVETKQLHPSWQASQLKKQQCNIRNIDGAVKNSKIVFDSDSD